MTARSIRFRTTPCARVTVVRLDSATERDLDILARKIALAKGKLPPQPSGSDPQPLP